MPSTSNNLSFRLKPMILVISMRAAPFFIELVSPQGNLILWIIGG